MTLCATWCITFTKRRFPRHRADRIWQQNVILRKVELSFVVTEGLHQWFQQSINCSWLRWAASRPWHHLNFLNCAFMRHISVPTSHLNRQPATGLWSINVSCPKSTRTLMTVHKTHTSGVEKLVTVLTLDSLLDHFPPEADSKHHFPNLAKTVSCLKVYRMSRITNTAKKSRPGGG